MRSIIAIALVLSLPINAYSQSGAYCGGGYAIDLHSAAAYPARGSIFGGYRFNNGIHIELRHTSALGSDDGIDITGDNENDIRSSENSLGAYYVHFFQ